ncbi:MAG: bifunctional folylpolyglutamate synthase/dihydrofolate synthase, partial [Bacteroidetes bacterium]|nr:bifunctional folylpolyglutamate synthase/dihydrofolate synthase [Bacteroidota bacterium]
TNGKGSVSHAMASVLQAAGYKTGLYTSPHLLDFRERIRINGEMIPEDYVVKFVEQYTQLLSEIKPSFFEWSVGLAFQYFAESGVDVAVLETGMGGRLDSTNICMPVVSVITNISNDHSQFLGDTLEKIAIEKAGIIKSGVPVVIGETQLHSRQVFINKANEMNAPVSFADQEIELRLAESSDEFQAFDVFRNNQLIYKDLQTDLSGGWQQKNLTTALEVLNTLENSKFNISELHIRKGIANVVQSTGLMGRWQKLHSKPDVYCDTAHNEAGITEVLKQISNQTFSKLYMVIGMVNDKDVGHILQLLPRDAQYVFTQASIPRAMPAGELAKNAAYYGLSGSVIPDVKQACQYALSIARPDDFIFVGGSTFVVAEAV